jgi:sterol desaturase/sphingolipid hydroxylase (fatty acid hydroxylase superfamily)
MRRSRALPTLFVAGLLIVPLAAVLVAIDRGCAPNLAATLAIAVATPLFLVGERLWPYTPAWSASQKDVGTDSIYALVLTPPLGAFLTASVALVCLGHAAIPRASAAGGVWPHRWPLLLQALLIGLTTEFFGYWWHRLSHERAFLWRLHEVHHSVGRVYFLNAFRFHPIDSTIGYFVMYVPILLLGGSLEAISVYTVFDFLFGSLQHANIDVKLGPLNWVLAGPELHRWHHSKNTKDGNANYGGTWIVYDVLFGTRHFPKGRAHAPDDVGLANAPDYPRGFWGQMRAPFTRRRGP